MMLEGSLITSHHYDEILMQESKYQYKIFAVCVCNGCGRGRNKFAGRVPLKPKSLPT